MEKYEVHKAELSREQIDINTYIDRKYFKGNDKSLALIITSSLIIARIMLSTRNMDNVILHIVLISIIRNLENIFVIICLMVMNLE